MNNQTTGFLLVDKPAGITSHDVVDKLRRITGIRKIGHAGTLDPFATGLLILAIGRESTKQISAFVGMDKEYSAEFVLGATSETLDSESEIIKTPSSSSFEKEDVEKAMKSLTGKIDQIPPMYSAIKINGKKLYELARKGETIERPPRKITIHSFELMLKPKIEDDLTILDVTINCSSGTYIRSLARDLAEKLGTTGYVRKLRRNSIGEYQIMNAVSLNSLDSDNWTEQLIHVKLEM